MEKIEVGEYVRTKNGKIRTVKSTVAQYYITDRLNISDNNQFTKEDIVKHSKNIIDLIEVKDIIEINNEKYEVIYDKSYCKLGILITNKEQLAIRHCSLEYIFSKQRNGRV